MTMRSRKRAVGIPAASVLANGIRGWRPEFRRADRVQVGDRVRLLGRGDVAFDVASVDVRESGLGPIVTITAVDGKSYGLLGEQSVEVAS